MYVLQLDAREREYLLGLLKAQHKATATRIAAALGNTQDVFGLAMWSDVDVATALEEQGTAETAENVLAVRQLRAVRYIGDRMVEHGWGVLEQGVLQLYGASKET